MHAAWALTPLVIPDPFYFTPLHVVCVLALVPSHCPTRKLHTLLQMLLLLLLFALLLWLMPLLLQLLRLR